MVNYFQKPRLPIPPPLKGSEYGSFAYYTVAERLKAIAQRIIAENNFESAVNQKLAALAEELPTGKVRSLIDQDAPDSSAWMQYIEPYLRCSWLDVPWFFAETYFYRRILEITGYFQQGMGQGIDPFIYQKQQGLTSSKASILAVVEQFNGSKQWQPTDLINLVYLSLWGNRADLSLWPIESGDRTQFDLRQQQAHLLKDDSGAVVAQLTHPNTQRLDMIVDNAGFELVCDLCFVDFLLHHDIIEQVYLHLKPHPTFVSDAMISDVLETITHFANTSDRHLRNFASRLQNYQSSDRFHLITDFFWTSPLPGWEMPASLQQIFSHSQLLIFKGDANYRRLLGDRHWSLTTPFTEIISYFPTSVVALRTLKSEVGAGLESAQIEQRQQEDPEWLTNGQWGTIQFVPPVSRA